jgi:protein-S-isoprenylcysteine O-methyltransferase Ste14
MISWEAERWIEAQTTLDERLGREDRRAMGVVRLIRVVVFRVLIYGGVMFLLGGTWTWWRAWALLAVVFVLTLVTTSAVFRSQPELLKERMKPLLQEGQPMADRIVLVLFTAAFFGEIAFIPVDVFRLHLMGKPPLILGYVGLPLFALGRLLIALSMRENSFAVSVVRHQEERHHTVVDGGIYGIVRHPMYLGVVFLLAGMSLWLESNASLLATLLPIGILAARIIIEERFLKRKLRGYLAYTQRVRWRLFPGLW